MTSVTRYGQAVELLAAGLLLVYPAILMVQSGGMNGVFLLMLLLAVAVAVVRPGGMAAISWRREWTPYAIAMPGLTLAIFLSQSYHQEYAAHPHDAATRYWLGIPVLLLLYRMRPRVFKALQYAFPVAAILGLMLARDEGGYLAGRLKVASMDLIHFGDFELMLGVLSLASLNWLGRDPLPLRMLKVAGMGAGLAASFASGSRGGWLAIPVMVALLFYFKSVRPTFKAMASAAGAAVLLAGLLYAFNGTFQNRINQLAHDVTTFSEGSRDTSTGIRWQLYKAAVDIFIHHPIFGVGPTGFAKEMQPMHEAGKLTRIAAELGGYEVHSDILAKAAGMGIFGLAAMLAIYVVPLRLFWRASKSARRETSRAGVMGVIFVSGFLIFGLTVEILNLAMATAFYSFTLAVLLAACFNIHFDASTTPTEGKQNV